MREEDDVDEVGARKYVHETLLVAVPHWKAGGSMRCERIESMLHWQVGIQGDDLTVGWQQVEEIALLQHRSQARCLAHA